MGEAFEGKNRTGAGQPDSVGKGAQCYSTGLWNLTLKTAEVSRLPKYQQIVKVEASSCYPTKVGGIASCLPASSAILDIL